MNELRELVKNDLAVREESCNALEMVFNENYATKAALLNQKIVDNTILINMLKMAGDEILDLYDDINEKDCLIDEYAKAIGDDNSIKTIKRIAEVNFIQTYDSSREGSKNKLIERKTARINKRLK